MASRLPRPGDREDSRTGFRAAEILGTREGRRMLLREIVALRNHQGGCIWVGVRESEGAFGGFDPYQDADKHHVDALRDQILDAIEPGLRLETDLRLEEREVAGGWILAIVVKRKAAGGVPAHVRSGAAREFLIRQGARIAPMPTEQVFASAEPSRADPRRRVEASHGEFLASFKGLGGLAVTVLPTDEADAPEEPPASWVDVVRDPPPQLARPQGWTWQSEEARKAAAKRGVLKTGFRDGRRVYRWLEVHPSGRLHFFTDLEALVWKAAAVRERLADLFPSVAGQIYPYCLVESVVSILRLGAELLRRSSQGGEVGAILSLEGIRNWVVPAGDPGSVWYGVMDRDLWVHFTADSIRTRAVLRPQESFLGRTDAVGYTLLRELYESGATGLSVEAGTIPWFTEDLRFVPGLIATGVQRPPGPGSR